MISDAIERGVRKALESELPKLLAPYKQRIDILEGAITTAIDSLGRVAPDQTITVVENLRSALQRSSAQ